ncbi:ATP-dependent RNA helicase HrpA [Pseudolysinimonas yzui]|uniref:ATP-dependent helicase n=1 Tax=Pseudolysinimonas yzui TaxID=2708254 RepID=A0A8J3GRZ1_9MICO|nr:ATP-dependent RNA helicase HrpA [Pseudolysinimonas yzui]GHF23350.1 ATP-dependent helicase [Pseudolysinimonas yzui]
MSPADLAITYPPELPVSQVRDEIARVIAANQVVIIAGETGSGKTTQLPKICLDLGRERIGHTQPRRIAARSVAERIASELGVELGGVVGYQVRFDDRSARDTRVKLMTDGVLLAELQRDRELRRYDTIIIDEAHERSLTIDFLLGYLAQLLPRRPDLKVIVTSATIDPESFARHFASPDGTPAPIVEVSGRTYPVDIRYRPLVSERMDDEEGEPVEDLDYLQGIAAALDELAREPDGDVLVFLSGEAEIRDAQDALGGRAHTEIVPLYGRLSSAEQHRVFDTKRPPGIRRRVVLATNVAETSLTVPGIKYVVDAGTARISRYSPRAKVQRLPIEAISQASANQRSGRAGRTSDGIAIRLYAEDDFAKRPAFTDPEILRTDLAAVILQMMTLGLGDIAAFPFLQPPDSRGVRDGLDLLAELGAVADGRLTNTGRMLAQLPVDVRFARMLIEAKRHGVVREVAAIVAGLSIQDPRERPLEKRAQADQQHARFVDPTSDFVTLLNLWNHLEKEQRERSSSAFRRMCKAEYLNYLRVREWHDLYRQVVRAAKPLGLVPGSPSTDADGIHRSLLAGLLSRLGMRDREKRDFLGARGQRFQVFPGSALAKKTPEFVMAAELVETSRLFARTVAAIDPAWAEKLAGDLAKRSYSEPHWAKKQGSAVAFERVTLFGLPIVARRTVQLGRIDPVEARELFLRHALIEGDWPFVIRGNALYDFDHANRALRAELAEVEERTRRRDILADDEAVIEFYDARIPREITDVRAFERWWKDARATTPELLTMTRADLLDEDDDALDADAFPDRIGDYALRYRFEPGAPDDGVTVEIPVERLATVDGAAFEWLVPGLREELITALLKALPKAIRKNVVPAADWARRLLPTLNLDEPLLPALAAAIRAATHTVVDPAAFELDRVPANLRMTYAAVDRGGKRLGASKSLPELRERFAEKTRATVAKVTARATPGRDLERTGITTWDLDPLPAMVEAGGVRGYPALVDAGAAVAVRVFATEEEALTAHPRGVLRLLALTVPNPVGYVRDHLTGPEKLALAASPYPSTAALWDDALLATLAATAGDRAPRDRAAFEALRLEVSAGLVDALFDTVALIAKVLTAAREVDRAIAAASSLAFMGPLTDARGQLQALVHPGFAGIAGLPRLRRMPVYLAGILHRVARLSDNPGRDRAWQTEVEQAETLYLDAGGTLPLAATTPARLADVRWMLEELRLSLFAQHLGAAGPVSVQRIRKALS